MMQVLEKLFTYNYQGNGEVIIEETKYLSSLSKEKQKEELLQAIEIYKREMKGATDAVQKMRFSMFADFAQHLLLQVENDSHA